MPDNNIQLASGQRGGNRENPEGQRSVPSASLSVPNNVPFVQPANNGTKYEPSQSALSLARTLGNIDFGSIGRAVTGATEAKRKLKDAQDQAKGTADTSLLLAQTGSDYETLIRSGALPTSASPAFQLGSSIAAAQYELSRLRKDIQLRASDNPNAPIFSEDPTFIQQYYQRLRGIRNEAVTKFFVEPMQELIKDDTTRFIKAQDTEKVSKFMSDAVGTFENAISSGDPISGALNNAVNNLKLSNHKTPETVGALIQAAGPQIVESSRDQLTGRIDLAKAGRMLQEIGGAKIAADGERKLSFLYTDEFEKLSNYVYGSAYKAAQASKEQDEASSKDATLKYLDYLGQDFSNISSSEAIRKGVELGLDGEKALNLYKGWDSAAGNVSQEEAQTDKSEADLISLYEGMTPSERKQQEQVLLTMHDKGVYNGREKEFVRSMKILKQSMQNDENKAPINAQDRSKIQSTLFNQLPLLFGGPQHMNAALLGATRRYGLSGTQSNVVRQKVAERLSDAAMTWIMQQPGFADYQSATENVALDQAAPARIMTQLTQQFLTVNGPQLNKLVPQALASGNPDEALSSIKLGVPSSPSAPTSRPAPSPQTTDASNRQKSATSYGAKSTGPTNTPRKTAATPNPAADSKVAVQAMGNLFKYDSPIFQWYKIQIKSKNPKLSDEQIMLRARSMSATSILKIQSIYRREHGGQ